MDTELSNLSAPWCPNGQANQGMSDGPPPLLMDARTVARELAVSVRTVWRLVSAGILPGPDVRIGSKLIRWKRSTLLAWNDCPVKSANCFKKSEDSQ